MGNGYFNDRILVLVIHRISSFRHVSLFNMDMIRYQSGPVFLDLFSASLLAFAFCRLRLSNSFKYQVAGFCQVRLVEIFPLIL